MNHKLILAATVVALSCQALLSQTPTVRPIEDKEAKALIAEFEKKVKANAKNLGVRLTAVQELGGHRNGLLVKPLLAIARSDKAISVRRAATEAIGAQPKKQARRALSMLLKKTDMLRQPDETASVVRALSSESYDAKDWPILQRMFDKSLAEKGVVNAQIAIIELAGQQQEVQAANWLVQHIDAPAPAWVDDPNNPPADYWEARHKNWAKWRGQVTEAMFQITGQRFGSTKEAKLWMRANGRELLRKKKPSKETKKK
jgi:hypothetical protein